MYVQCWIGSVTQSQSLTIHNRETSRFVCLCARLNYQHLHSWIVLIYQLHQYRAIQPVLKTAFLPTSLYSHVLYCSHNSWWQKVGTINRSLYHYKLGSLSSTVASVSQLSGLVNPHYNTCSHSTLPFLRFQLLCSIEHLTSLTVIYTQKLQLVKFELISPPISLWLLILALIHLSSPPLVNQSSSDHFVSPVASIQHPCVSWLKYPRLRSNKSRLA